MTSLKRIMAHLAGRLADCIIIGAELIQRLALERLYLAL